MSKRKIAYISQTVLLDCDLPLLYELSKNATVDYFLVVTSGSNQGTLVDMTLKACIHRQQTRQSLLGMDQFCDCMERTATI